MNSYNLRATSVEGEEVIFTMKDIPTKITKNTFVISQVPNSPILLCDTVVRGADVYDLFEGDIIVRNGKRYYISFRRGFAAVGEEDKEVVMLKDLGEFERVGKTGNAPKTLSFKYRGHILNIGNIIGAFGSLAILNNIANPIDPTEIQHDACFSVNGTRIFFGDLYQGKTVFMHYGRACIEVDGEIIDIEARKPNSRGEQSNVC